MDAAGRRPLFVGKTKNTGIRVNETILERAVEKSKRERAKTGGNLSQLMEWLLWIYIGQPGRCGGRSASAKTKYPYRVT